MRPPNEVKASASGRLSIPAKIVLVIDGIILVCIALGQLLLSVLFNSPMRTWAGITPSLHPSWYSVLSARPFCHLAGWGPDLSPWPGKRFLLEPSLLEL